MRIRSSIFAKEVTICRRGTADDTVAAAAAAAAAPDCAFDDECAGAGCALAVGARSHEALPNTSQHTHTTVRACVRVLEGGEEVKGVMVRVTRHTSHVTSHTPHVIRHTSHVTRHTSHVTRHTSYVIRHTSHVTRHLHAHVHACLAAENMRHTAPTKQNIKTVILSYPPHPKITAGLQFRFQQACTHLHHSCHGAAVWLLVTRGSNCESACKARVKL